MVTTRSEVGARRSAVNVRARLAEDLRRLCDDAGVSQARLGEAIGANLTARAHPGGDGDRVRDQPSRATDPLGDSQGGSPAIVVWLGVAGRTGRVAASHRSLDTGRPGDRPVLPTPAGAFVPGASGGRPRGPRRCHAMAGPRVDLGEDRPQRRPVRVRPVIEASTNPEGAPRPAASEIVPSGGTEPPQDRDRRVRTSVRSPSARGRGPSGTPSTRPTPGPRGPAG